jgi:hypothetical protein
VIQKHNRKLTCAVPKLVRQDRRSSRRQEERLVVVYIDLMHIILIQMYMAKHLLPVAFA